MEALLLILALAAAPTPGELPARPPHPDWSTQPLRMALFADTYGDAAVFEGEAVYEADKTSLRAGAVYETFSGPFQLDLMTVSISAGRQLSPRDRLDLELRQGLNRASGGLTAAFTLRRALEPTPGRRR